ncbi:unnamed protein product, partial [Durusdinium trenchii]
YIQILKDEIANIDKQYDVCSAAWCTGESEGFFTEEFYKQSESAMKKASIAYGPHSTDINPCQASNACR